MEFKPLKYQYNFPSNGITCPSFTINTDYYAGDLLVIIYTFKNKHKVTVP